MFKQPSRRDFLKLNALAGAGLFFPWVARADHEDDLHNLPKLNGGSIPKYQQPLCVYNWREMPRAAANPQEVHYELAIRQFYQQILPVGYPATRVAGYGAVNDPTSFWSPAFPMITQANENVRVKWINDQRNPDGTFQPHVLADEMFPDHVMWANPAGPEEGHGHHFAHNSYHGPVPVVTHLHGGASREEADGHPFAWYLPDATNIPHHFRTAGSLYETFKAQSGLPWEDGNAIFDYGHNDVASLLWCHDHTMGITEYNVYAGFAGAYLVRGGQYDVDPIHGPKLPQVPYDIPLVIQDRSFKPDGSLLFHGVGEMGGDGDTMMVNGRTWPYLNVERRRYRFRVLNGCNNVPLKLEFSNSYVQVWVIGSDIGFLPRAVRVRSLPLTNAERADLVVDFTNVPTGTVLYLLNKGGDARPGTTGQVMKIIVGNRPSTDPTTPGRDLEVSGVFPVKPLPATHDFTRQVALFDERQGTPTAGPLEFVDPPTETPKADSTEVWEIHSDDSHPIHLHAMRFQVLGRQRYGGTVQGPKAWEKGLKDTVDVQEDGVTWVKVKFEDTPGRFVWHCHLLMHEDMGMMRPLILLPKT